MSLKQLLGRQVPDCAIIGGGPVGLIFAILGSTSIGKVQIFESKKHGSTNQDNRALALSNGSRLILEEIGVWDPPPGTTVGGWSAGTEWGRTRE